MWFYLSRYSHKFHLFIIRPLDCNIMVKWSCFPVYRELVVKEFQIITNVVGYIYIIKDQFQIITNVVRYIYIVSMRDYICELITINKYELEFASLLLLIKQTTGLCSNPPRCQLRLSPRKKLLFMSYLAAPIPHVRFIWFISSCLLQHVWR